MTNLFDVPDGTFSVLVNAANQHSLWPAAIGVPAGWAVAHGPADRAGCLDYVAANWTDLRPARPGAAGSAGETGADAGWAGDAGRVAGSGAAETAGAGAGVEA